MAIRLFLVSYLLFSFGINASSQDVNLFFQKSNQFFSEVVNNGKVGLDLTKEKQEKRWEIFIL